MLAAAGLVLAGTPLAGCSTGDADRSTGASHPPHARPTDDARAHAALGATEPAASVVLAGAEAIHATLVTRTEIGTSRDGEPIHVYRVSGGAGDPDAKPGLFVVAGLHGLHTAGPTVARQLVGRLDGSDALRDATLYVLPRANPDAEGREDLDLAQPGGTLRPNDDDRDGRTDEDGPRDLNADGVITMMRVADPPPGYGLQRTHIADPGEPRLMRRADTAKNERATHAMLIEGIDADGDGGIAEDGLGGVLLDRNFPYRWGEFADDSGPHPLSEPESRAIADWLLTRPNIVATLAYGPHDSLVKIPDAGKFDQTGRVPTGIENGDKPIFEMVSEAFKDITELERAEASDRKGSFTGWSYAHMGHLALATSLWQRPEAERPQDEPGEAPTQRLAPEEADEPETPSIMIGSFELELTTEAVQAAMAEVQSMSADEQREVMEAFEALPDATRNRIMAIGQGLPDPAADEQADDPPQRPVRTNGRSGRSNSDDAKWLAYADEAGSGYVDWTPVEHPQLGDVEVGGFVPGFKIDPPEDAIEAIIDQQAEFVAMLLEMLPRVSIDDVRVERVGDRLWRIGIVVRNEGDLPTRTAMGVKSRRLFPHVLMLDVEQDRMVSGDRVVRVDSIPAGGEVRAEWLVVGAGGSRINASLRTEEFGTVEIPIRLREGGAR